jgi:hypothetical protein
MRHNEITTEDAGMTVQFHAGCEWSGASEFRR